MAKRKTEETEDRRPDVDPVKLSKLLIQEFNKNEAKTGKLAWNLATDIDNPTEVKEWINTGSTLLNYVISNRRNGGVPVGKLTEISGEEASGKSLLCAHLAADVQRRDGIVIYIDTENAMSPEFMVQLGVDLNKMVYLQPGTVEEVMEAVVRTITVARQKAPDRLVLIIWDSVAGTPTKAEIEGTSELNMNDQLAKSKLLSKQMRIVTETLGKERVALVFTNQLKTKIGVMYGDPMTTPGGKAIPYHASVRIRLTRGNVEKGDGSDEQGEDVLGVNTMAKIIKNRMGPPLRKCRFFISFANGIEDVRSWFTVFHEKDVIVKDNGWCYIPELPSGKIEEKGAWEGKDRGIKFRESQWEEFVSQGRYFTADELQRMKKGEGVDGNPIRPWLEDKLEQVMIVRYGQKSPDMELNPESLMEMEQTIQDLIDPK